MKMDNHTDVRQKSGLADERRLIELSGNYRGDFEDLPVIVPQVGQCEFNVLWLLMMLPAIAFATTVYFLKDLAWGYFWLLIGGHCFIHQILKFLAGFDFKWQIYVRSEISAGKNSFWTAHLHFGLILAVNLTLLIGICSFYGYASNIFLL